MRNTASRLAGRIGQAMLARHSLVGSLGWTALAVAVPTLLRLGLDGGRIGTPFVTYFPAIVIATLFLGWRWGVLTTALCAVAARLLFMAKGPYLIESAQGWIILALFVLSCAFLIATAEALRRVLGEVQAASVRAALLNDELRHRLKNLLAVVGSLASLSWRHTDPEQAEQAFTDRLSALDRATSLLGGGNDVSCVLPELPREALRPFLSAYDIRIEGPSQAVDRDACVPAVLAFYELATNAIKYGALSDPKGWVGVTWGEPENGKVTLLWHEHDGPPVAAPIQRGMGTRILSMRSSAASFALDYAADGVRCEIALKAA